MIGKRVLIGGLCGALTCVAGGLSAAEQQQCVDSGRASTPTERFAIFDDGTVRDRVTGLLWKRCAVGQSWDGTTCREAPRKQVKSWFSWQGAKAMVARLNDPSQKHQWRMPSISELKTLVESRCQKPAINLELFPNAPAWPFWSSSELSSNPDYVWRIDFSSGKLGTDLKTNYSYYVRLVKGEAPKLDGRTMAKPRSAEEEEIAARNDGIHDIENPDLTLLQRYDQATLGFPLDTRDQVDWAKVLLDGIIEPRTTREGDQVEMAVWDHTIIFKDTQGMPWVRFPHKLHSMWLACENCHDQFFETKTGTADISMQSIYTGQHCGACHGRVAFSPNSCERCHSELYPGVQKWW
ncbi:DUF1566 domain-containing protein [Aestuariirhabdus litorea]|uniref:DUF1566 domain-containing protein n=1 Tax=Aestuariirhabdus litorea TaxID=2528527 RepID=A0A3P3VX45_9GAMM|nr:DUF1566 domain-containing protein [Aestuariirhabdus litorea]RRJ85273.1 DUF1566 domain-containing protein [Aestuariirhabdus litorea]RWW98494.1 DUF1566 domain-containing protein [Endozoicomonadaceae bacterium GTF-13]